MQLLRKVSQ